MFQKVETRILKIFLSRHFVLCLCAFSAISFILLNKVFFSRPAELAEVQNGTERPSDSESEMACKIPKLDAFDESIRHLTSVTAKPANCDEFYTPVFRQMTNNTLVRLNGTEGWKDCCYRVVGKNVKFKESALALPSVSTSGKCYFLSDKETEIPAEHEFIGVYCSAPSELRKKDLSFYADRIDSDGRMVVDSFAFTPLKLHVEDRVAVQLRNFPELNPEEQVNVLLIGLDAVSHMTFKRTMPRVVEFLVKNLSAISMNGFNRIGEDTFENTAAFLNNMTGDEVKANCLREERYGDTCPLIWKDFRAHGYRTSIAEDWPRGEIYAYNSSIVDHPPVDYHLEPLKAFAFTKTNGPKRSLASICVGPRLVVDLLLQYVRSLAALVGTSKRYFQFVFSGTLTHDDLAGASLAEANFLATLEWLKGEGHLNNTVLIFVSDHGARAGGGDIVHFSQGKIEGNMPPLYFVLPEWMKQKYPRAYGNLKANSERLTTAFDIYATLKDILQLKSQVGDAKLKEREEELNEKMSRNETQRGISLFLPIPTGRTCESAEIGLSYCVCRNKVAVNISSPLVSEASAAAVEEVNRIIKNDSQCAELNLKEVISATQDGAAFSETWLYEPQDQVIEVEFRTSPGNATFLGVMTRKSKDSGWISSGRISRTNLYGSQSYCVKDRIKKSYCYCKDLLVS